jgi:hypothetical protein
MQFKINEEILHTRDMVSLEINGIFLTIYLDPAKQRVFFQTLDEKRGVTIRPAPHEHAQKVLAIYGETDLPDIASCCRKIGAVVGNNAEGISRLENRAQKNWELKTPALEITSHAQKP